MCICSSFIIQLQLATNSMDNTAYTWPQLDISPCSYQLFLQIDHGNIPNLLGCNLISVLVLTSHVKCHSLVLLILLCLAASFFYSPKAVFVSHQNLHIQPVIQGSFMECLQGWMCTHMYTNVTDKSNFKKPGMKASACLV